jgi:putative endopeptidase
MYRQGSHVRLREQYAAHLATMLGHAGRPDPERAAASVLGLETISLVETFLGHAAGEHYVAENLAPGAIEGAVRLVDALVQTYRKGLERAGWLRDNTRIAALRKLDNMVFEIGSPSNSNAFDDLRLDAGDLIGNVMRGRQCQIMRDIARLGTKVDRSEWKIHPQQVTAYYRRGLNQVVIPAAMLQPPLFRSDGDMARNFAVLGSIICHEMSHAFDSYGSRYDEYGRVRNWWATEDRAEFTRRTALLVSQYDKYEPRDLPGHKVSGARTLGENIADVVGITVAQGAFADYLTAQRGALSDDQGAAADMRRFFVCWASMWRAKCTRERMRERLASDSHAPAEFRCNGVIGHIEAFYNEPFSS